MIQRRGNVAAAVLGTLLLGYVPIMTGMRWDRLPSALYHARMIPFFVGVLVLGALVSRAGRVAWAAAIAVARVAFQDVMTRIGILGSRSSWGDLHEFEPFVQGIWLVLAVLINLAAYVALMTVGNWAYRRWRLRRSGYEPVSAAG